MVFGTYCTYGSQLVKVQPAGLDGRETKSTGGFKRLKKLNRN